MSENIIRKSRQKFASQVAKSSCLTSAQKLILRCLLFDFYNVKDGRCYPSDEQIQAKTAIAERTIRRARIKLVADGWITYTPYSGDMRRRTYKFPKLVAIIQSMPIAVKKSAYQAPKRRTFSQKATAKMAPIPIYNNTTTPINQEEAAPSCRHPVYVDSSEHEEWDEILRKENLPPLRNIFPPEIFGGKLVFWIKPSKIELVGSAGYNFDISWFCQQVDLSNINQKDFGE